MPDVEVTFEHQVEVWTVGDLKRALASIPDDTKLAFFPADEPGGDITAPTQVAFTAGMGQVWNPTEHKTAPAFVVSLEFPPGTYYRTVWKD